MSDNHDSMYERRFQSREAAEHYEQEIYRVGSYNDLVWRIEQSLLETLVMEFRKAHDSIEYLDFACGTGRVLSFMQNYVDQATGIEISQAMVDIALMKSGRARVKCCDITNEPPGEQKYDLITAFRFFTNAEPSLRLGAMKALANRLRDDTSWLVFNNHGNLLSRKALIWPLLAARNIGPAKVPCGRAMTHGQVLRLVDHAGLRVKRVSGCDILGARLAKLLGPEIAFGWESKLSKGPLAQLGTSQLYVAQLK